MANEYGYCPHCGAPGFTRERRLNGDDICQGGHKYPSATAIQERPMLGEWKHKMTNTLIEVVADHRGYLMYVCITRPDDKPNLVPKEHFTDFYERL